MYHVFPTTTKLGELLGHMREFEPRAGGAGMGLSDAINRAMGELLERYACLAYQGTRRIVSSYNALSGVGLRSVPLETLTLFSRQQLMERGFPYTEFSGETPIGWFEGTDLATGSPIYVPGQLISLGYVPRSDEVLSCFYASSSGCALAASAEGALVAGLLECIERDAVMMRWYARLAPPILELDPANLLGRPLGLQSCGLEIRFHDMTVDGEVPVVGVTCIERSGRPCFFILSAASALDTVGAARRSIGRSRAGPPFRKVFGQCGGNSPRWPDLQRL